MKIEEQFEQKFLSKLKRSDYVGVEIEMPLINTNSPFQVDSKIVQQLFMELLKCNFVAANYDNEKNIISLKNINNGDTISVEYSFNTLEFSLNKERNIYNLMNKFNSYYEFINDFLKEYDYKLCDVGINPNYKYINRKCLNQDRYKVIEKLLINEENILFSQFCSYCCSVQTHINLCKEDLVDTINLFTKIRKNKELLFSNSYMEETRLRNSRMFLWQNSNFGPVNIGENKVFKTLEEIKEDYLNRNLFFVERNNKFFLLKNKCSLIDYYNRKYNVAIDERGKEKRIKVLERDFENFRSYKDVELTKYGTLEIRTDCTPKVENIFKLVAFNVGISLSAVEILEYIQKNNNIDNNKLIEFAILGLKGRKKDEERLLEDL